jgi:hypothetical protein
MSANSAAVLWARRIEAFERARELLFELEQGRELSAATQDRVQEVRLWIDRVIEELRAQ